MAPSFALFGSLKNMLNFSNLWQTNEQQSFYLEIIFSEMMNEWKITKKEIIEILCKFFLNVWIE